MNKYENDLYWKNRADEAIHVIKSSDIVFNPSTCCYTPALLYPRSITPLSDNSIYEHELSDYSVTVYIHIPYCTRRCSFCPFFLEVAEKVPDEYIDLIIIQLGMMLDNTRLPGKYSVSIGGGSPNLLNNNQLKRIIDVFVKERINILNIELHPECLNNSEYITGLIESGINRVSVGLQSSDNNILRNSARGHNSEELRKAAIISKLTPLWLNIDVMYGGMFGEYEESAYNTFEYIFKILKPDSVNAFRTSIHEGTPERKRFNKNSTNYPNAEDIISITSLLHKTAIDNSYKYAGDGFFYRNGFNKTEKRNKKTAVLGIGPGTYSWIIDGYNLSGFISFAPYNIKEYSDFLSQSRVPVERKKIFDSDFVKRIDLIFELKEKNYILKNMPGPVLSIFENLSSMKLMINSQRGFSISDSGILIEDLIFAILMPENMWEELSQSRRSGAVSKNDMTYDWLFNPDVALQFLRFVNNY